MIRIVAHQKKYEKEVIDLIINIQRNEFNIPITINEQPDLLMVDTFYQVKKGNFWIAINETDEVVGTIALIDVDEDFGTIRKMFVRADYRGKEHGIAQKLFDKLEEWSTEKGLASLYLGTLNFLEAAQRFYIRNGFYLIDIEELPKSFLRMSLDNRFYKKVL